MPDAFVAKGIARRRRVYKSSVEGKQPDVVIETTSRKTRRKDTEEKPQLCARLGVKEYFLFDLHQEYLEPPLQGYRLAGAGCELIAARADGSLDSAELGLRLQIEGRHLRFVRLDTGARLLTRGERARFEVRARQQEAQARLAAEAEVARLRAELARRARPAEWSVIADR